jgi:hypothetical protein
MSSVCTVVPKIAVSSAFVLVFAAVAAADPQKSIRVNATGQILHQTFPTPGQLCQDVEVTGVATVIGRVSGALTECVDLNNGSYAGIGVFTTPDGSTISTEFSGQLIPNPNGTTSFFETHRIVDGTGQYENASGGLDLTGTGDATGHLDVVGTGTLIKG